MADYKELLRRAISALPENNGAARRAVYEKARSALVGQLRAITPPLPARDITQHRLQLEDCIRQVEQEASEAIITLGRETPVLRPAETRPPEAKPVESRPAESKPVESRPVEIKPTLVAEAAKPVSEAPTSTAGMSIEEIITQAAATTGSSVVPVSELDKPETRSEPRPLSGASRNTPPPASNVRPIDAPLKSPSFEPRRDSTPLAANSSAQPVRTTTRIEPALGGNQAVARQQVVTPQAVVAVEPALSSIREVELEPVQPDASEAEGAIERAIETLDREARGEPSAELPEPAKVVADRMFAAPKTDTDAADDSGFVAPTVPTRSGQGLTIFLIVFVILLAGVGGAGYWAWREGYIDLDQMFNQAQPVVAETNTTSTPTLDPVQAVDPVESNADATATPGNTATTPVTEPSTALQGLEVEDRLEPTPEAVVPTGAETALPDLGTGEVKGEERLPGQEAPVASADDPTASVDPAILAGSQSLLLEASADGVTGAVPFSGTVEWSEGVDELGLPTLIGRASIPARNLGVDVTIRKNADPSLPASHVMEVDFQVNDTFIGGTIANLPGVLLKNEELVPGTALVGASARVVGNSFLFALSATPADVTVNAELLENRKWMDLAVVYGTGRNAIITLEKDETAQALFDKVFAAWAK